MKRIFASVRSLIFAPACILALSLAASGTSFGQAASGPQDSSGSKPRPHAMHIPQHGGIFFMALDNEHHIEGVLLRSGVFRLYLYDAFTRPLPVAEVQQTKGSVQVGESENAPVIPLTTGKDKRTLEAAIGKSQKLPVTITLSLRFQQTAAGARPEVFTFPFSQYIAADASPKPPVSEDTRLLILFIYSCVFLVCGVGILMIWDRMVAQADQKLPQKGTTGGTSWLRSLIKPGEFFRLWRAHRQYFPRSPLRFLYASLWVLTLSWLFFGLNLLQS